MGCVAFKVKPTSVSQNKEIENSYEIKNKNTRSSTIARPRFYHPHDLKIFNVVRNQTVKLPVIKELPNGLEISPVLISKTE